MLSFTGHDHAISSSRFFSSSVNFTPAVQLNCIFIPPIFLGKEVMIFSVLASAPLSLSSRSLALIAIVVNIQAANEVPMRSVGENRSPLPWLSVGASVSNVDPDCKWVAKVLSSPQ